jgi:hypothetical protein
MPTSGVVNSDHSPQKDGGGLLIVTFVESRQKFRFA